jgi:hypothetical protein
LSLDFDAQQSIGGVRRLKIRDNAFDTAAPFIAV